MTGSVGGAAHAGGGFGARIFLLMAAGYLLSYGLRAINATIAPELSRELALSNTSLGTLTSAYFVGFAAMQIPVGIWLDRFGPRRVNATLMAVAGLGCAVLATAASLETLWVGRLITGVGFASGLMGSYAMFRIWFAPNQQTRLASWILMCGTFGVLIATTPVRMVMPLIGWRGVFAICAVLLWVVALAMWFGLPRQREPDGSARQSLLKTLAGYGEVIVSGFFWRMALACAVMQGGFIALQTLWLGPWLIRVLGYSPERAAEALLFFNGTLLVTYLLNGLLAPRLGSSLATSIRTVTVAMPISIALLLLIAAWPTTASLWAWMGLAVVSTVFTPIQARVGLAFPARISGRTLTAFNLVVFSAVIVIQSLVGLVIDGLMAAGQAQVDAFRVSIGLLAALQISCWLVFVAWRRAERPDVAQPG